ncbi:glycine cleavage system aminomethyltransferase GcvT [Thalassoroseus pseudoceratinae]|uniref:glycine cleavage system aminomethyltransferase GcvT n=1 Tax=Thalassoroseus pseudoceratinae TaxID=2713176 RepID=UPI00142299E3|nr:glycine cleavage system aminomethyltransferase GcvT [Thalassoroseus pseudoceratinae]
MTGQPMQTAFYDWHVANGGRMVDFAGWEMPIRYGTIIEEHQIIRSAAGLFDIAHMGRLWILGADAQKFLNRVVTMNVSKLKDGQVRYALVTNESGGVLDDVLVYRVEDGFLVVVNASNREKIVDWFQAHTDGFDITLEDRTQADPMFALQGPKSFEILNPLVEFDLSNLRYYRNVKTEINGVSVLLSRTGYTGEDGFEIIAAKESVLKLWEHIHSLGVPACGLGCRDTLRLEAGMPLYGHELSESIDPISAGLEFAVHFGCDFIGESALQKLSDDGPTSRRIGLSLDGRRVPREGCRIFAGDQEVGEVTSGTFSPTLERPIAMAYVASSASALGTELEIEVRNSRLQATVVELPFYKRKK